MIIISGKRNSGKTTILLHGMVLNPYAVYVVRTNTEAARKFEQAQQLDLNLTRDRFMGVADAARVPKSDRTMFFVDDADYLMSKDPALGASIIARADVITLVEVD